MTLGKTTCVKCEMQTPHDIFTLDADDPDIIEKMADHFMEVHGVDVTKFKKKDKNDLHY